LQASVALPARCADHEKWLDPFGKETRTTTGWPIRKYHYNYPMAKGQQHAIATVLAGGVLSGGLLILARLPLPDTLAFAGGCLSGLLINPDLDMTNFTHAEGVMRATFGKLGGSLARLWYGLWWPYSHLIIPKHRHPLSHFPVLGTALRLIYLAAFFLLAGYILSWVFKIPALPTIPPRLITIFGWSVGGLVVVDTLHYLMDSGTTSGSLQKQYKLLLKYFHLEPSKPVKKVKQTQLSHSK
jgi:uncharacterized metal-binding protein